ncbi:nucleotidyltransferase domain-containing protein [Mesorhizobium sp. ISC15]|uniref:nucleotidyltransferase domain-containing protein n=1 Tax=Mesorhizobium sp. ISC15 TaxID=3076429 RepID=UPI00301B76DB
MQGSYGNDTNIWADSDVDIVLATGSMFYFDIDALPEVEKGKFHASFPAADTYSYADFKKEVTAWLTSKFGSSVKPGTKAIFIEGNGNRRDSDVLPAAEFRHYFGFKDAANPSVAKGIVFWKTDGTKIVNFPKQHSANCTTKHQATNHRFKPAVRMFKNMRNKMIDDGYLEDGIAPSYYIEGLLSNAADYCFSGTLQEMFNACMNHLRQSNREHLMCANGIHWLVRDGAQICWSVANFNTFMAAVQTFWDENGGKRKTIWL